MQIGIALGVWDLFHYGHLKFIERAKKECDILVIGVCSDNLTMQHKKEKPIINENQRLEIIRKIKDVSAAFIYNNTDYIEICRPYDLLIIGEEFGKQGIKEHGYVLKEKPFKRISRTPDISSTQIKEAIRRVCDN